METDLRIQLLLTAESEHVENQVQAMCRDMTFLKALDCLEQSFDLNKTDASARALAYFQLAIGYVEFEKIREQLLEV